MKRFRKFTDDHPLIAVFGGWVFLFVLVLVLMPADPVCVDPVSHHVNPKGAV